ncbi:ABC transporter ATP-binding protein [Pseudochelatococcus sp. B33]
MSVPFLSVSGVGKRFGGFVALDGIDFTLSPGERVGLIGPNGSGKSTFVNCLTGALIADDGRIVFEDTDITRMPAHGRARMGLARSFQIPRPFKGLTIRENIEIPLMFAVGETDRQRNAERAEEILASIGLAGRGGNAPASLSQVELRKLELGRALAANPRLLIADEAMAGLSDHEVDEILELLFKLNRQGIAIILIEHIMRAVMGFSERIVVLVTGRKIADGAPRDVMAHPEVERAYLG